VFRDSIAAAYTSDPAVQKLAADLLLFAAIFQLSDAAQVTASCAIRGYKITRTPMLIHLMAFYGFALPIGCLLGLAPEWMPWRPSSPMASQGFWIGLILGLTIAGGLLLAYLQRISSIRSEWQSNPVK
jgi:MATE family multidrug resistance protein